MTSNYLGAKGDNSAVYTRENKPRTPRINGTKSTFTAYSTDGYFKPRLILAEEFWVGLIQAAAYLGRESVRINGSKTLSAACCPQMLRMLCFQLYPRPSRLRDARCSGGKVTCCTRKLKILSKQHLIHMHPWNISFKPLDWSLTNVLSRFPHKFRNSATLILNEMLIWKNVKYGNFLDQSQSFSQITLGTKTNYFIIGPVWPLTKPWTIYTSSSGLMLAILA